MIISKVKILLFVIVSMGSAATIWDGSQAVDMMGQFWCVVNEVFAADAPIAIETTYRPKTETEWRVADSGTAEQIIISNNIVLTDDFTPKKAVYVEKGGLIDTVTHSKAIDLSGVSFGSGDNQCFNSAPGQVVGLKESKPEWFGAARDGVTDFTSQLQSAINSLADHGRCLLTESTIGYFLSGTITPKTNTSVECLGSAKALIKVSPSKTTRNAFFYDGSFGLSNIAFRNIQFVSANDHPRSIGRSGMGSNVYVFHFTNVDGLTIDNVNGDNLEFFIKGDGYNSGWDIQNIKVTGTYQPIYIGGTVPGYGLRNLTGFNWNLDCSLDGNKLDHHLYLNGGLSNWSIKGLVLSNGTGNCSITLCDSTGGGQNDNIHFSDIVLHSANGFNVANSRNVSFRNITGTLSANSSDWQIADLAMLGFQLAGQELSNVSITNFNIRVLNASSGAHLVYLGSPGTGTASKITISNGVIDANGKTITGISPVGMTELSVFDVDIYNAGATSRLVYVAASSASSSSAIRNCSITYPSQAREYIVEWRTTVNVQRALD